MEDLYNMEKLAFTLRVKMDAFDWNWGKWKQYKDLMQLGLNV